MGGHGGLNILPQKRWNVYNYENREKVLRDEEAAAQEEQLKREQSRKRDAEFRLERLRQARGLHRPSAASPSSSSSDANHINLFEGLEIFPLTANQREDPSAREDRPKKHKKEKSEAAAPRTVTPEDEKYRLGYGVAGRGVKLPWYLSRPGAGDGEGQGGGRDEESPPKRGKKASGKKSLEELREERLKRETKEKKREKALLSEKHSRERYCEKRRIR